MKAAETISEGLSGYGGGVGTSEKRSHAQLTTNIFKNFCLLIHTQCMCINIIYVFVCSTRQRQSQ